MRILCYKVNIHGNKEAGQDAGCHGCNLYCSGCCGACCHGDFCEPGDLVGIDEHRFACHGTILVDIVDPREIVIVCL